MQLRGLLRWLIIETAPVWLAPGIPIIALAVIWPIPIAPELKVRVAGYLLTLVGVILVINNIRDKRRLFERPSLLARVREWLSRFPSFFGQSTPRTYTIKPSGGGIAVGGGAHVTFTLGPGAPIHERVDALERNLSGLRERVSIHEQDVSKQLEQIRVSHSGELAAMKATDQQLGQRLEELSVGGVDLELTAVAWVLIGGAYGTFPQEIANVVERFLH